MMAKSESEFEEDWEEVEHQQLDNQTIAEEDENGEQHHSEMTISIQKRQKQPGITKDMRNKQMFLHQSHAVFQLFNACILNALCDDSTLQGLVLSQLPFQLHHRQSDITSQSELLSWLSSIRKWLLNEYFVDDQLAILGDISVKQSLIKTVNKRNGNTRELTLLFVALLRALGLEVRLVYAIQVPSLKVQRSVNQKQNDVSHKEQKVVVSETQSRTPPDGQKQKRRKRKAVVGEDSDDEFEPEVVKSPYFDRGGKQKSAKVQKRSSMDRSDSSLVVNNVWFELLSEDGQSWVPFGLIDIELISDVDDKYIQYSIGNVGINPQYIVALAAQSSFGKCVSARYLDFNVRRKESCLDWWKDTISGLFTAKSRCEEADQKDYDAFSQSCTVMPKSLAEFNNHPQFVIEKYLKKFEVIHPKDPAQIVGQIRGHDIYPRSLVQDLHTAEKWISQEARVVKAGEYPIKKVKSRVMPTKRNIKILMEEEQTELQKEGLVGLFGFWQTEPYRAPPIVNGIIPKNKYGNMDLFREEMLPEGAFHISERYLWRKLPKSLKNASADVRLPTMKRVAQDCNIEFAEAVIGFEYHGGRSVPSVDGIVVAEDKVAEFVEEFKSRVLTLVEKAKSKQLQQVASKWNYIYKKLLHREKILDRYN
ncbi:hypothetical protein MIR68_002440 [Amoeboaphelidium protococcarum]|nr:hypothetical protein MIR68_002440 [Amoeboaphelidium protococcarum]